MLPFLTNEAPWFSFLGHPRHKIDLDRIGGVDLLRRYSISEADFLRKIGLIPPLVIGEISFGSSAIRGEVVAVMNMPDLMVRPGARQAVLDGIDLAVGRGARVVGLGALTAPATGAGLAVLPRLSAQTIITTGNAYTAAVGARNVAEACELLGRSDPRIAVLGCTGSVGFAASHLLAKTGAKLTLIGRTAERVRTLFSDLEGRAEFAGSLECLVDAEVVLVLTSDSSARLRPELLRAGAIIIDVAQPANIPNDQYANFRRHGIQVSEGGLVHIPGYRCSFDFGLPEGATFACLAETYLFAREGITESSVGRASPELAVYLERLAERHGLTPCPLSLETARSVAAVA